MDKNQTQAPPPETGPSKQPTRRSKNSLLVYVAVMFAVAFLLVLLSFLSQQRDSNQTISTLSQTSATAVGRVQELEEAYTTLTRENQDLADQVEELTEELETLQGQYDLLSQTKSDLEQELAQAKTDAAQVQTELDEASAKLEAATQDYNDLSAQVQTLTDRLAVDTLLEQGSQAALGLDYEALAAVLAQIDQTSLDAAQQALFAQLQQKLTLGSSTEQG